ncbi:DUF1801 domain-containing protein [Lichenifustis flavocetrariae]|uniref:DUF1801 domain-containing protein n=1 Tax=Lichenifustis flavocetrariae TaxID=2949735 RepID=A0AA42CMG4_9HYPH|nr:DUF1801 domain-containing protein [Lichenifustis flavocetrariae]MCW6508357.1 DUF1801 domain-containing protein [Lichenifustis flavocetrariae]
MADERDIANPNPIEGTASDMIDARLKELNDWRGETLARIRQLIREADHDVVEEVKWRKPSNPAGVPTWCHAGILCTGEVYKDKIKLTFAQGASLEDPAGLFNSSLDAGVRRAIDIGRGEHIDEAAFRTLIKAAVTRNTRKR